MGRTLPMLLLLLSSPALAQPLQPQPQPQPQAEPPAAASPAQPPQTLATNKRTCRSNLYLEPTLLVGGSSAGGVARLHAAAGFRYSHCPAEAPDSFRVYLGAFAQVGSEEIGDAFTKGIETEYSRRLGNGHLGGRAYYGTANNSLFIVGGGVRYRQGPAHVGFEMIYSSRSTEGQGAAVGGLVAFGVGGKAGAVVAGVLGVLALVALSQFTST